MSIFDLPWFNKPDVKLEKKEAKDLDSAELLAIILGSGNRNEGVLELSNRLIKKYNLNGFDGLGLNELINFIRIKGHSYEHARIIALRIISLTELSKRYNKLVNKGYVNKINSAKDVYNMFVDEFRNYKKEVLHVVLLDTKNKIIKTVPISVGTLNSSLVHPREVFKEAIRESANSIILVHNHPSGDCSPSSEDIEITKIMIKGGDILGVKVLDHVIIGEKYYSWREEN